MTDTDTIKMLYDGYNCVADYNDADNLLRHYITPGLDENVLVYDVDNTEEYFYLHDGLGTVRQIINDTQTIENNYDYEGFGTSISHSENIYNRYRYTGREYDKETESDPTYNSNEGTKDGLYYYRARTYDSTIGSFTSRDPIPHINLYTYCAANPITFTDPYGTIIDQNEIDQKNKEIEDKTREHIEAEQEANYLDVNVYTNPQVLTTMADWIRANWEKMCSKKDSEIWRQFMEAILEDFYNKAKKNPKSKAGSLFLAAIAFHGSKNVAQMLDGHDQGQALIVRGEGLGGSTRQAGTSGEIEVGNWPNIRPWTPGTKRGVIMATFPKWGKARTGGTNKYVDIQKKYSDNVKGNKNIRCYLDPNGGKFLELIQDIINNLQRIIMHEMIHYVGNMSKSKPKAAREYGVEWTIQSVGTRWSGDDGTAPGDGTITGENWWVKHEGELDKDDGGFFERRRITGQARIDIDDLDLDIHDLR